MKFFRTYLLFLLVALTASACGSRSGLVIETPDDLVCPLGAYPTRVGVPVTVEARGPERGVGLVRWEVVDQPTGARPSLTSPGNYRAEFSSTTEGAYLLRASIPVREGGPYPTVDGGTSDGGVSEGGVFSARHTCLIAVNVGALGPQVTCPAEIRTRPLEMVSVTAQVTGDRAIRSREWTLVDAPAPSSRPAPMPRDQDETRIRPDVAGDYRLRYTVQDVAGAEGRCETVVRAVPTEALRVELFWNPPNRSCGRIGGIGCDASDVDLHLQRNGRGDWNGDDDCHFRNCPGGSLRWAGTGGMDNPRLDLDVTTGFGPENINLDRTFNRAYRIGVHMFAGHGTPTGASTVVVFCGGTEVRRLGPVTVTDRGSPDQGDLWLAADVVMTATGCNVLPILRPNGMPWINQMDRVRAGDAPPPP